MENVKVHTKEIYKLKVITPRKEWDGVGMAVFHLESLIYLYFEYVLL